MTLGLSKDLRTIRRQLCLCEHLNVLPKLTLIKMIPLHFNESVQCAESTLFLPPPALIKLHLRRPLLNKTIGPLT